MAESSAARALLDIEVIYAVPARSWRVRLQLPRTSRVGDAVAAARGDLVAHVPDLVIDPARIAVFGRAVGLDEPLHPGDRVELLRPLHADPKDVRRRRARG